MHADNKWEEKNVESASCTLLEDLFAIIQLAREGRKFQLVPKGTIIFYLNNNKSCVCLLEALCSYVSHYQSPFFFCLEAPAIIDSSIVMHLLKLQDY